MKTILKLRDICKAHDKCFNGCPLYVDNECVLGIPPANWSDENLYLISKALKGEEAKVKTEMIAMLEELKKEIEQCGVEDSHWIIREKINSLKGRKETEFHCGVEESGFHAYNCNDCPNKCEEWHKWDKEIKKDGNDN